jgi:hypothetical protein
MSPDVFKKTPGARFELATNGLTVHCSTTELTRIKKNCHRIFESHFFTTEILLEDDGDTWYCIAAGKNFLWKN